MASAPNDPGLVLGRGDTVGTVAVELSGEKSEVCVGVGFTVGGMIEPEDGVIFGRLVLEMTGDVPFEAWPL